MSVVVGYQNSSFKAKDTGEVISGCNVWLGEDVAKNGEGQKVERVFLSDRLMERENFVPVVGAEVDLMYNRYGRIASISAL